MFFKIDRVLLSDSELTKYEMLFPCIVFLSRYTNNHGELNTTLNCIAKEFDINPTTKNVHKIKTCMELLVSNKYIYYDNDSINLNTPLLINSFIENEKFFVIHDFEIKSIIEIVNNNKVSFMIGSLFLMLKFKSFNRDIYLNQYSCNRVSYSYLRKSLGISSNSTIFKYLELLSEAELIYIDSPNKLSNTVNEYSFKEISP